jgi:rare lipoprotein A
LRRRVGRGRALAVLALCTAVAALLHACATGRPAPQSPSPAVSPVSDGPPLRAIGPGDVTDAVPRPDPILAVGNRSPYTVNGVTYEILEDASAYRERGIASWYGTKFDGQKTSNGEIYDLYQASAAHKTLPIPCYARVTNLENSRSIVVRVNDRGPFHADRLIDLSYGAAVKLGFMERGTASVEVEVLDIAGVDDRRDAPGSHYRFLQLGAFGSQDTALRLQEELRSQLGAPVTVSEVQASDGLLYRVRVGPVASADELLAVQQQLQAGGYQPGQPLP